MFINEYGNRNDPLIPLLAPMMVTGRPESASAHLLHSYDHEDKK